jgi:branched-chain amino acid transport system substrate-binding protein
VTVTGKQLTIYLSSPSGSDQVAQDVLDAERLAFSLKSGEVTAYKLALRSVSASKPSNNARTAIQDTSAIAYLGEIVPGSSADSLGITNAQDLLQVSPTDTAAALTQTTSAVSGSPSSYYESLKTYGRTFARVVGTTAAEARVAAAQLHALGVHNLYLADDGSDYGRTIATELQAQRPAGVTISTGAASANGFAASGADALFYATASPGTARTLFSAVSSAHPQTKLFGPSALADPGFAASLGSAAHNLYVSAPGTAQRNLPAAGQRFASAFRAAYHRTPLPQAAFGFEAMAAVIDVIKQAGGSANKRGTVVHGFFGLRNRASVLGTYSINVNGDTSLTSFVVERVKRGRLVPLAQPSG